MKPPPPIWKELTGVPKRQHLATLQRVFDNTAHVLSVHAPIFAKTGLLNMTLSLGFRLDHQDYFVTFLHQFGMVHITSATWKVLKARIDQHHFIMGDGATPSLD